MKSLSILFCGLLFICGALSQDGASGQQQEINRETIEAIMNAVSPDCKNEMETAIQSQSDVSPDCKLEIQQAVRRLSGQQQQPQSGDDEEDSASSNPQKESPSSGGIHPGVWITLFVVALFGGVAAYASYVNGILAEVYPQKAPKKLSKKKLEKQRMKGN